MPFCPKCGKKIDYLIYWEKAVNVAKFDKYGDYWSWETVTADEYGYECPECGTQLFGNEEDAKKFLSDDVEAQLKALGKTKED